MSSSNSDTKDGQLKITTKGVDDVEKAGSCINISRRRRWRRSNKESTPSATTNASKKTLESQKTDEHDTPKEEYKGDWQKYISVIVRVRFYCWWFVGAVLLLILTTAIPQAPQMGDVPLWGFFFWLEISWTGFWISYFIAYKLGIHFYDLSSRDRLNFENYDVFVIGLKRHMAVFFWTLISWATTPLMCRLDSCASNWLSVFHKVWLGALIVAALFFAQRIFTEWIYIKSAIEFMEVRKNKIGTGLDAIWILAATVKTKAEAKQDEKEGEDKEREKERENKEGRSLMDWVIHRPPPDESHLDDDDDKKYDYKKSKGKNSKDEKSKDKSSKNGKLEERDSKYEDSEYEDLTPEENELVNRYMVAIFDGKGCPKGYRLCVGKIKANFSANLRGTQEETEPDQHDPPGDLKGGSVGIKEQEEQHQKPLAGLNKEQVTECLESLQKSSFKGQARTGHRFKSGEDLWKVLKKVPNTHQPEIVRWKELQWLVTDVGEGLREVMEAQKGIQAVVFSLEIVISLLLCIVIALVYATIFVKNIGNYLTPLWTTFTGISFALQGTVQEFIAACVFVFARHPYDVHDRVSLMSCNLLVKKIGLMSTTFESMKDKMQVHIPHSKAGTERIDNLSRTQELDESVVLDIDFTGTKDNLEKIGRVNEGLKDWVNRSPRSLPVPYYYSDVSIRQNPIQDGHMKKLGIKVCMKQRSLYNTANEGRLEDCRTQIMGEIYNLMEKEGYFKPPDHTDLIVKVENS